MLLAVTALCLFAFANSVSAQATVPAAPAATDTPAPAGSVSEPVEATSVPVVPAPVASDQPDAPAKVKLREGTGVKLTFAQTLNSRMAEDGDVVEFVLAEDLKVGDVVVAKAGSKAYGEVSNARPSGMLGKSGELNIRMDFLAASEIHIPLRESQDGDSGSSRGLNPIGLIKHGKDVEIPQGAPLKAYVSDDIMLLPATQAAH
jgi:hypothetical protein